jgi:hypothetical protein
VIRIDRFQGRPKDAFVIGQEVATVATSGEEGETGADEGIESYYVIEESGNSVLILSSYVAEDSASATLLQQEDLSDKLLNRIAVLYFFP